MITKMYICQVGHICNVSVNRKCNYLSCGRKTNCIDLFTISPYDVVKEVLLKIRKLDTSLKNTNTLTIKMDAFVRLQKRLFSKYCDTKMRSC